MRRDFRLHCALERPTFGARQWWRRGDTDMTHQISNSDDMIDIRDVIDRVEDLSNLRQPGPVDVGDYWDLDKSQDELFSELAALEALIEQCRGNGGDHEWDGDWFPVTLVRDS